MRGKGPERAAAYRPAGITPAYAGKSMRRTPRSRRFGDHPRLCGEKFWLTLTFWVALGSPPPMRGKVLVNVNLLGGTGITPAYAGKSA